MFHTPAHKSPIVRHQQIREPLGFSKPVTTETITAGEHFRSFRLLDTNQVWTADGWLVTAVQEDGVTHHLRRGNEVRVMRLEPETVLHFNHNAKSRHWLN